MNYIEEYHKYIEEHPKRIPKAIKQRVKLDKELLKKHDFKEELVDNIIGYIEFYCVLDTDKKFKMTLVQKYMLSVIFGFWTVKEKTEIDVNGEIKQQYTVYERVVKEVLIMVASGFGKTTFLSALNFFLMQVDKLIPSPQIFIGSNAHQQSKLCFDTTMKMLKRSKFTNYYVGIDD